MRFVCSGLLVYGIATPPNEYIFSTTVSSCKPRLGQINRVKHEFDKNALIVIINALVFTAPLFGSTPPNVIWSNSKHGT